MKNATFWRSAVAGLLWLYGTGVTAHGVHVHEGPQGAAGIMGGFIHLFVQHGYWLLFLIAGFGLVALRTTLFHRGLEQGRGSKRRYNHHQYDR